MPINIVCHGILSRTARDTAAFYAAAEEYFSSPRLPEIGLVSHPGKRRFRIGLMGNPPGYSYENPDCIDRVAEAGRLCESLGHEVEDIPFPFDPRVMNDFFVYWAALAFSFHHFGKKIVGSAIDKDKLEKFTIGGSS